MNVKKLTSKKIIAGAISVLVLAVCIIVGGMIKSKAASVVTVHFMSADATPNIYYWNTNGSKDNPVSWPGTAMTAEKNDWYKFTINASSSNLIFNYSNWQTGDLFRESGEWWFYNNTWYNENPLEEEEEIQTPSTATPDPKSDICVHFYSEWGGAKVYYWKSSNDKYVTSWPGVDMTKDKGQWYKFTFEDCTSTNLIFNYNGQQTSDLSRTTGEWWYKNNQWYSSDPDNGVVTTSTPTPDPVTPDPGEVIVTDTPIDIPVSNRTDFRDETIYFLMTTRFYDGDKSNNVHCWDDAKAKNPDSDPAWRGDFKGLIKKLDYIKAMGFTAVWITPVVQNASGYDYHGYHAINFSKVDPRYESSDTDYQDLIDACHAKGIKIIQDIVINHTGNFGEKNLYPLFDKTTAAAETSAENLTNIDTKGVLPSNYSSLNPDAQYGARIDAMKEDKNDTENIYHHEKSLSWESYTVQTGQIAGDCVDLNTENPNVAAYLESCYNKFINMGVDSFRIDTLKHVSRLTMNKYYIPSFMKTGGSNFYIFGECCTRYRQVWNNNNPAISVPFYTWAESKNYSWGNTATNMASTAAHYVDNGSSDTQPTSSNAFLSGNNYHSVDTSKESNCWVIDFPMHWNFNNAYDAFRVALDGDKYYSDATYNVTYVDSHDYAPDCAPENQRFAGSQDTWAENLNLMFSFRGIPCIYYGSEIEFQKGKSIDVGPNAPLSETGRAYYGDYLEGNVNATGFGTYTADGKVAQTLSHPLALHIQRLNKIRASVPALRKGQYSTSDINGSGMSYKRRYTNSKEGIDSFALVCVSGQATFGNIPNGTYREVITGKTVSVTSGSLTSEGVGKGNMRIYVLDNGKNGNAIGKIGSDGAYLK